ncbi:hypothetical protein [Taibaiella koreensis]|uniref:hypothetical protein n=1 Tax=Taibaiella koreensis TaxID=1268548 RepID=UPI000E59D0F7|nr:hypothetical protein [Taibaiella koreensis]
MKPLNLQEDLIRDFQEQKKTVKEQVALIDPMATSLRKPAAKRLFHTGIIVFMEILCWLLVLGCIAFVLFADKLYPFYYLSQLQHDTALGERYKPEDLKALHWMVRGAGLVLALLLLIVARMLAAIRLKNSILHIAGKNMKQLVEQLLKRKAAMENMEQKYPSELPQNDDAVVIQVQKPHNDILL